MNLAGTPQVRPPTGGTDNGSCGECGRPFNDHTNKELAACLVKAFKGFKEDFREHMRDVTAGGTGADMKSHGRPDESWDEARIRALIRDAIHAARERGVPVAVHQDERGDVVMSRARIKHSFMYACVVIAYVDKRTMGYATELTGNVPHERYTMGQMIPRVRDALVRGIFEYDASGPNRTVQKHLRWAVRCAERLARMRKEPFIAGMTDKWHNGGADLREAQVRRTGGVCVQRAHNAWSLPDLITS